MFKSGERWSWRRLPAVPGLLAGVSKAPRSALEHFCVQLFCVFTPAPVTPQSVNSCRICFLLRADALDIVLCLLRCGGEDGGWMLEMMMWGFMSSDVGLTDVGERGQHAISAVTRSSLRCVTSDQPGVLPGIASL